MAGFPTFAAELGYAVARGWLNLTMADIALLARYPDVAEAAQHAREVRKSADTWTHIRDQLRIRIHDLTTANLAAGLPRNAIMAQAHDINRSQTLGEAEVTAIAEAAIRAAEEPRQPTGKGRRRHA